MKKLMPVVVGALSLWTLPAGHLQAAEVFLDPENVLMASQKHTGLHHPYNAFRLPNSTERVITVKRHHSHILNTLTSLYEQRERIRLTGNVKLGNNASFLIGVKMKFE